MGQNSDDILPDPHPIKKQKVLREGMSVCWYLKIQDENMPQGVSGSVFAKIALMFFETQNWSKSNSYLSADLHFFQTFANLQDRILATPDCSRSTKILHRASPWNMGNDACQKGYMSKDVLEREQWGLPGVYTNFFASILKGPEINSKNGRSSDGNYKSHTQPCKPRFEICSQPGLPFRARQGKAKGRRAQS